MFLPYLDNCIFYCGLGIIEAMLEPHMMSTYNATSQEVGYNFLLMGLCYMVSSPICGYVRIFYFKEKTIIIVCLFSFVTT